MAAALASVHVLLALFATLRHLVSAQDGNQFVYNGFHDANLHLRGIARIHPSGLLELTNTSKQEIGQAFFPFPLHFISSSSNHYGSLSFSSTFVFAMVPELPTHGGHGIAFVISASTDFTGAMATQYLGLFNSSSDGSFSNHVLVVELDTERSPDLEDIDANHVGIDINSLKSIASAPVAYFPDDERANKSLELLCGTPMQVWIEYDEVQMLLNVTVAPARSRKPKQPLLSKVVDLSKVLLDSMYVGFSASTGSVASHHYILGWSFNTSGQAQSIDYSKLPMLPKSSKKPDATMLVRLMVVVVMLITITAAVYLVRRKKFEEICEDWEQQYGPRRFSYEELHKATKGFKEEELLGFGGSGRVYKGVLPLTHQHVAVKKVSRNSKQAMKEFVAEIASMGRLRHRNLVQLLGYCRRKEELLLVYEHMPNGSLDKYLFSNEKPSLNWSQRYRILKGVASGLLYLHEEWEQVVLHRDVKASNVLLDADLNGRLGDFGLAKFYDHGENPQTTSVVGTVGYLAPELTRTGKPTTSSEVFSFGSFLLEVACGRKPVDPKALPEQMFLADWVLEYWKGGDILAAGDPRLEGNYVINEMELVLKLGLVCTHPLATTRPTMRQVVQYLDGGATFPEVALNGTTAGLAIVR